MENVTQFTGRSIQTYLVGTFYRREYLTYYSLLILSKSLEMQIYTHLSLQYFYKRYYQVTLKRNKRICGDISLHILWGLSLLNIFIMNDIKSHYLKDEFIHTLWGYFFTHFVGSFTSESFYYERY